ncbi:MAG: hypothetical protein KJ607_04000 [Bacteroidetes bacterium]|nr:hypothetical protein [Bacteroidota bacterium]
MQRFRILLLACFLFPALLISCRKEKDAPPVIDIRYPLENQQFSALDTIPVEGRVTDDKKVISLSVRLIDQEQIAVSESMSLSIEAASADFNLLYPINNIHLESGSYYLRFTASDEKNRKNESVMINIGAIQREVTAVYIISDLQNQVEVYKSDTSGQFTYQFGCPGIYRDACISSYHRQIYLLTGDGCLYSYNLQDNTLAWQKTGLDNISYQYIGNLLEADNLVWVGHGTGRISAYDNYGYKKRGANLGDSTLQPSAICAHGNSLIVEEVSVSGQGSGIGEIVRSTGIETEWQAFVPDAACMFSLDDDKVILWCNSINSVYVCTLSVEYNMIHQVHGFPEELIYSAVQLTPDLYLACIGEHIYSYNALTNSLVIYKEFMQAQKMVYEDLYSRVLILSGENLFVMNYPDGAVSQEYVHSSVIKDLVVLYNK